MEDADRKGSETSESGENTKAGKETRIRSLFRKLSRDQDLVSVQNIVEKLEDSGISKDDIRIKEYLEPYLENGDAGYEQLNMQKFLDLLKIPGTKILRRTLEDDLVIPDFRSFEKEIASIFKETRNLTKGEVNNTVPHPERDPRSSYAVSICTVDGQLLQLGDHDLAFVLQSVSKPVNYAIAYEEAGKKKIHEHVGAEPGSESFDSGNILNERNLPHNPMLTSGAMMTSSFIQPSLKTKERLEHVMEVWEKLTGDKEVGFNEDSFAMEQKSPNKHLALAHLMQQRGAFPDNVDLESMVEFYFKCCAIEVNIDDLAHAAATLANYGWCPSTGKKVFGHDTTRDTLSLMYSSGMYDRSGEFAFRVGMPAKSGIAGGIMVVVPGLMGTAVYSPPLDPHGNSLRGVAFCEALVDKFNVHKFDAQGSSIHSKKDPRKK